jgi:hypothetical protein
MMFQVRAVKTFYRKSVAQLNVKQSSSNEFTRISFAQQSSPGTTNVVASAAYLIQSF